MDILNDDDPYPPIGRLLCERWSITLSSVKRITSFLCDSIINLPWCPWQGLTPPLPCQCSPQQRVILSVNVPPLSYRKTIWLISQAFPFGDAESVRAFSWLTCVPADSQITAMSHNMRGTGWKWITRVWWDEGGMRQRPREEKMALLLRDFWISSCLS